jgi:hypothetical protein
MNKMLEHAIAEVARLPEDEQEAIACLIIEEAAAERGWDERFAASENKLAELARKATEQHGRGETTSLVFPAKE